MERLTERSSGMLPVLVRKRALGPAYFTSQRDYKDYRDAIDRLAAYEDTGLDPEEIEGPYDNLKAHLFDVEADLKACQQAEAEGRLLVLPCKVGDTVYLPQKNDWGDLLSFEVIEIGINRDGPFFVIDDEEHDHIPMSDIGADVFLSREEAEAALKKEEADHADL